MQRPLFGVPWALVGSAPGWVPRKCHRLRLELYPWLRRLGGSDGKHYVPCVGHLVPILQSCGRVVPHHCEAFHVSLGLMERGYPGVLL